MQDLKHGTSQPPPANNPLESQYNSFSHGWLSEEVDLARVALDELLRRDKEGKLSPQHRHEIDKMALATMSAPITTPVQYYLAEELSDRLISGKLPAEDQATIYQNAVTMGLSARPVVMQWDAVPVSLTFQTRLPRRLYVEVTYKSVRIDGGEVDASHLPQWRQPISVGAGPTNVDRLISYSTLGQHRIGLDVRIDILASSTPYQGGGTIVHSETRTVSTSFSEIQPTPVVKMTRFIGDPEHEAGHYLSVGRLTHVIEFSPPYLRDLAITEMIRRGRLGELTDDQHDGLVDQLLGIQKDRNQPWNGAYGDYIESRRATMKLSDIKWREYGKQQLGFFMVARPEIRQGDPLPIGMVTVARRGNSKVGRFEASQWEIEYSFSDDVPRPWNVDPWNEGHLTLVPHWGNDFMTKSAARFPDAPPLAGIPYTQR